jgi:hypothetical protein
MEKKGGVNDLLLKQCNIVVETWHGSAVSATSLRYVITERLLTDGVFGIVLLVKNLTVNIEIKLMQYEKWLE